MQKVLRSEEAAYGDQKGGREKGQESRSWTTANYQEEIDVLKEQVELFHGLCTELLEFRAAVVGLARSGDSRARRNDLFERLSVAVHFKCKWGSDEERSVSSPNQRDINEFIKAGV